MKLVVTQIRRETDGIKSFRLAAADGAELSTFAPGAHLPLNLPLADGEAVERRYSILSDPAGRQAPLRDCGPVGASWTQRFTVHA